MMAFLCLRGMKRNHSLLIHSSFLNLPKSPFHCLPEVSCYHFARDGDQHLRRKDIKARLGPSCPIPPSHLCLLPLHLSSTHPPRALLTLRLQGSNLRHSLPDDRASPLFEKNFLAIPAPTECQTLSRTRPRGTMDFYEEGLPAEINFSPARL